MVTPTGDDVSAFVGASLLSWFTADSDAPAHVAAPCSEGAPSVPWFTADSDAPAHVAAPCSEGAPSVPWFTADSDAPAHVAAFCSEGPPSVPRLARVAATFSEGARWVLAAASRFP